MRALRYEQVIASWGEEEGGNLPSPDDVAVIRAGAPGSFATLRASLGDRDSGVRMRAAYTIEKLGPAALPLRPGVLTELGRERDALVTWYLVDALLALGPHWEGSVDLLDRLFNAAEHEEAKTALAGALVRMTSPEQHSAAWKWLVDSLRVSPPPPPGDDREASVFWERRWGAVSHLRHVRGKEAIVLPLLERLRDNPTTPQWVLNQQVLPAILEAMDKLD